MRVPLAEPITVVPLPLDGEGERAARSQLVADVRSRLAAPDRTAHLVDLTGEDEHVAWLDHALEAAVVDPGEEGDLAAVLLLDEHGNGSGLRHRLDDQNAGHHRPAGEVTREPRILGSDLASGDDAPARLELEHLVDQEKRLAVREDLLDLGPPERCLQD